MKTTTIAMLLLLSHQSLANFSIEMRDDSNPETIAFIQQIEGVLPKKVKEVINKKIFLEFKDLKSKSGNTLLGQVAVKPLQNRKKIDTIELNKDLLAEISPNTSLLQNRAARTIIHEIGHVYDYMNDLPIVEKDFLNGCSGEKISVCREIKKKIFSISDSPLFLNLTGWYKKGAILKKRINKNNSLNRRVDIYESKNPAESYAVNFEHFLLDPEFACRKPSLNEYLSRNFNFVSNSKDCKIETRIPKPEFLKDGKLSFFQIDPSRLYEIHYLHAADGKEIMSRWGHSMVRLVMCSPRRKQVNEDCLKDQSHHLVLSFRADITGFQVDYIKGLTGKYPSKLFLLSFLDVIKEYTQGELRDVYSIPLKLDPEQKKRFVAETIDRFWNYEGKYYFLSNNCADETLNMLQVVIGSRANLLDLKVTTPRELRKKLSRVDIIDTHMFSDLEEARKKGYYFLSSSKKFETVFNELKELNLIPEELQKPEKFLENSTLEQRKTIMEKAITFNPTEAKAALGKLIFIEEIMSSGVFLELNKAIGEWMFEASKSEITNKEYALFKEYEDKKSSLLKINLDMGYGIPLEADGIYENIKISQEDLVTVKNMEQTILQNLAIVFKPISDKYKAIQNHQRNLLTTWGNVKN